jgi:hypothetical protein
MPPTYVEPGQRGDAETGPGVLRLAAGDARVDTPPRLNSQIKYSRIATSSAVEVYDGMQRIGIVERRQWGGFRAIDADGRHIGELAREREAAQAITSRTGERRAAGEASS